jgi:hypothetical protein
MCETQYKGKYDVKKTARKTFVKLVSIYALIKVITIDNYPLVSINGNKWKQMETNGNKWKQIQREKREEKRL